MKPIIAICFVFLAHAASAQLKPFSLGPYVEKAFVTGSSELNYKDGLGIGITADIKLPGRLGLTGSAGYFQAAGLETEAGKIPGIKAFPVRGGLKFRPLPFFYLKFEAGAADVSKQSGAAFILSPGVGVRVLGLDFQGKYEKWSGPVALQFWGLRASLQF